MCVRRIVKNKSGTEVLKYMEDPSAKGIPILTDVLELEHPAGALDKNVTPAPRYRSLRERDMARFAEPRLTPKATASGHSAQRSVIPYRPRRKK
jgi:hypothetical protein